MTSGVVDGGDRGGGTIVVTIVAVLRTEIKQLVDHIMVYACSIILNVYEIHK